MISRFLPPDSDISDEISKTAIYLRRFGADENIKIFSTLSDIKIPPETSREMFHPIACDNHAEALADFARTCDRIKPVVVAKGCLEKARILRILYYIIFLMMAMLLRLNEFISDDKKAISFLKESVSVVTKDMSAEINEENFPAARRLVDLLKDSRDPIEPLRKASAVLKKYGAAADQMSLENGNQIKIKTSLGKEALERLKFDGDVRAEKSSNDEYEKLGSDGKTGVVLCIK
jgi:hypothetical protein